MSLLDVLRIGVAVVNTVTKPIQATVSYTRSGGEDFEGAPIPGTPVPLQALVEWNQKQVRTSSGELTVTRATVTFLDIAKLVAATGGEGIGDDDVIVLPDGTTGPILDLDGFIDAGTGHPLATTVMLG